MQTSAVPELHQPSDIVCPYPNCGLAFGNLRTLKKHHDLHSGGSNCIKCNQCCEVFADLALYEKHWRSKACSSSSQVPLQQPTPLPRMESEPPAPKRRKEGDRHVESATDPGTSSASEEIEKEKLVQHLATVAMRNTQQIYMCQQRESDLVLGLEECSLTLDRALHMIMVMSGGNLNNIPIDMQLTSLKYSANRRQIHPPTPPVAATADYVGPGSDSGESSPVVLFNNNSSSSSSQPHDEADICAQSASTRTTHISSTEHSSPPSTEPLHSTSAHSEH